MIKVFITTIILCFYSGICQNNATGEYKIIKIDSIKYHYVINVVSIKETNKKIILISSRNFKYKNEPIIKVNEVYSFKIRPTRMIRIGDEIKDSLILNGRSFTIDDVKISNNDLPFISNNLNGLYFVP